jgi:putative flippase GtrA
MIKKIIYKIRGSDKDVKHFLRFGFFCFVGLCAFLIDWGFFNLFYSLGLSFVVAMTFSVALSMLFNFSVNRNVTFSGKGSSIRRQISKWLFVYFIAFLARIFVGNVVLILLGENLLTVQIAYFMGILVAIPIDYFGSLLWVFRKS